MDNTNWTEHKTQIIINSNPIMSKALVGALTNSDPMQIVDLCLDEVIAGIKLNTADLPFYAAALQILLTSIKSQMSERDDGLYTAIMTHTAIFPEVQKREDDPDE